MDAAEIDRAGASSEVTVSTGDLATSDMVLNIGPQHPATHGVLRLRLRLDGERIVHVEPVIGYMHRGAEKLFEVRDYRQIIVLANRHDWLSAFSNELGVVLAVERMLGMEVPVRAVWARTLLAELNRVLNHLMFLGSYPLEVGAITPVFYAFREREALQAVMEEVSGGRMHYMFNRVGGLKEDLPAGWTGRARATVGGRPPAVPARCDDLVLGNEIFARPDAGVGVLGREQIAAVRRVRSDRAGRGPRPATCAATSRTSPTASSPRRAARRDPHRRRLPTPASRCCSSRSTCRWTSPTRAWTGWPRCPPGPINVRLPKVRQGARGHDLRLDREPARHQRLLPGLPRREDAVAAQAAVGLVRQRAGAARAAARRLLADMVAILGSMFFVVGDVDK